MCSAYPVKLAEQNSWPLGSHYNMWLCLCTCSLTCMLSLGIIFQSNVWSYLLLGFSHRNTSWTSCRACFCSARKTTRSCPCICVITVKGADGCCFLFLFLGGTHVCWILSNLSLHVSRGRMLPPTAFLKDTTLVQIVNKERLMILTCN